MSFQISSSSKASVLSPAVLRTNAAPNINEEHIFVRAISSDNRRDAESTVALFEAHYESEYFSRDVFSLSHWAPIEDESHEESEQQPTLVHMRVEHEDVPLVHMSFQDFRQQRVLALVHLAIHPGVGQQDAVARKVQRWFQQRLKTGRWDMVTARILDGDKMAWDFCTEVLKLAPTASVPAPAPSELTLLLCSRHCRTRYETLNVFVPHHLASTLSHIFPPFVTLVPVVDGEASRQEVIHTESIEVPGYGRLVRRVSRAEGLARAFDFSRAQPDEVLTVSMLDNDAHHTAHALESAGLRCSGIVWYDADHPQLAFSAAPAPTRLTSY